MRWKRRMVEVKAGNGGNSMAKENRPMSEEDRELMALANKAMEEELGEGGAPEWMATFSDMMSLLLAFFILMFSMSEIKLSKFMQAAESLREGLGQSDTRVENPRGMGARFTTEGDSSLIRGDAVEESLEELTQRLSEFIRQHGLQSEARVVRDETGVTLHIQSVALFRSGNAELLPPGVGIMRMLYEIFDQMDYPLIIRGHTDNIPISNRYFPSNWELSAARAGSVARVLVEMGLTPEKIHVEGHAEYRPIAANNTRGGRAQNRRVEIAFTREHVAERLEEIAAQLLNAVENMEQ